MWVVVAYVRAVQALCGMLHPLYGLLQPLCGLSLANAGNDGISLCGGYRAFSNIPHTRPSLTTRVHVDMRFDTVLKAAKETYVSVY